MSCRIIPALTLAVAITVANVSVSAAVLVQNTFAPNSDPNHKTGYFSVVGGQQIADDFSLALPAQVMSIEWYGYFPGSPFTTGDFRLQLYQNETIHVVEEEYGIDYYTDLPAAVSFYSTDVLALSGTVTGCCSNGNNVLHFIAALPESVLLAPATYWLSIQAYPPVHSSVWGWNHGFTAGTINDNAQYFNTNTGEWANGGATGRNNQAFTINGSIVPLPGAIWLFGSAIGVMGWVRRNVPT